MKKSARKTNFIDPQVQGVLARRLVIHWLLFLVAVVGLAFGLQWMNDPFQPLGAQIGEAWGRYGLILMVLICLVPVFVYDSIKLSHRFAGPVFRVRQVCHQLANGETPDLLVLRPSDFWKDLAHDINRVADRLAEAKATATGVADATQESES